MVLPGVQGFGDALDMGLTGFLNKDSFVMDPTENNQSKKYQRR